MSDQRGELDFDLSQLGDDLLGHFFLSTWHGMPSFRFDTTRSTGRGGGAGGHYWHIHLPDTRVGYVYINELDEAPFGKHASIQIHINQTHRGRGIGSLAYRLSCEQSAHDVVIATMRKSNFASQNAASRAGFKVIQDIKLTQQAMRWTRS